MEHIKIAEKFEEKKVRYQSIDVFRGIAIVGMIFVNTLAEFHNTPAWSKHAVDYGLTYVDLIAPFFIFAIALTYKMTYEKYMKREGAIATYVKIVRRYTAFLGMGFLGSIFIASNLNISFGWGVLQAIGLAGLFTMLFIHMPQIIRYLISLTTLAIFQNISSYVVEINSTFISISDWMFQDSHGGFIGGIIWGAMMLLSTAVVDDFKKNNITRILVSGIILTGFGTLMQLMWQYTATPEFGGISKERMTPAYVLLSIGLAAILFWIIWFIYDKKQWTKNKSYVLEPYGKNSFFMYIIHPLVFFILTLIFTRDAYVAVVFTAGILNVAILWGLSFVMDKKNVYIII